MQILVHENDLEPRQIHVVVDLLILGVLLVLVESNLPVLLRQGRDSAHDGVPLHHRQSRIGQACYSA